MIVDDPRIESVRQEGIAQSLRTAHHQGMGKVTLTTELPIPAATAAALARQPEMIAYVLSPVLRVHHFTVPEQIEVGTDLKRRGGQGKVMGMTLPLVSLVVVTSRHSP